MPTWIDLAFFVLLAVLFPLWAGMFGMRSLRRATWQDLPRARLWLYRRAILIQWTLTTAVIVWWFREHRLASELGLGFQVTPGLIGVLVGVTIIAAMIVRQRTRALGDDESLAHVRHQLARLELMLPRSRGELAWFYGLSVTAGLCEELLYRGYLIWFLTHWLGLFPAVGVAGLLFGLAHAYQGPRGMALTAGVGLFLGGIYLVTGSLYVGMVVHALMDVHSGHLGYVALSRRASQSALDGTTADAERATDEGMPPFESPTAFADDVVSRLGDSLPDGESEPPATPAPGTQA